MINNCSLLAILYMSVVMFLLACSMLLAGDDTGSVWLYDMEPCFSETKTIEKHDIEQAQVNVKHVM